MAKVVINQDKCKGCLLCVNFCPKGALVVERRLNCHGVSPVKLKDKAKCVACAMCAVICPDCCIEVYK